MELNDIYDICLDIENCLTSTYDTVDMIKHAELIKYIKDRLMELYQYTCAVMEMLKE